MVRGLLDDPERVRRSDEIREVRRIAKGSLGLTQSARATKIGQRPAGSDTVHPDAGSQLVSQLTDQPTAACFEAV